MFGAFIGFLCLFGLNAYLISRVRSLKKKVLQVEADAIATTGQMALLLQHITNLVTQMQTNLSAVINKHANLQESHLDFQKNMADFCTQVAMFMKHFAREDDPFAPPKKRGSEDKSN